MGGSPNGLTMPDTAVTVGTPLIVAASVAGADHLATNAPCQDAFAHATGAGGEVMLAVADGMGSAPRGGEGARLACDAAVAALVDGATAEDSLAHARQVLETDPAITELACTLLVAVGTRDRIETAHIGDGAIVAVSGDTAAVISQPANGEYANETDSLTSPGWRSTLRLSTTSIPIGALFLFTDGCHHAGIRTDGTAHPGFFIPLLNHFRTNPDNADLERLLSGAKLGEHSGDDKTMVMAVWR